MEYRVDCHAVPSYYVHTHENVCVNVKFVYALRQFISSPSPLVQHAVANAKTNCTSTPTVAPADLHNTQYRHVTIYHTAHVRNVNDARKRIAA